MNRGIMKRDSFRDLDKLERRLLGNFFSPMWQEGSWEAFPMPSHLTEDENNYYLQVELPGVNRENIKVDAGEKYLHIHGDRKEAVEQKDAHCHYSELTHGSFSREYHFNTPVDKDKVEGSYRSGILKLKIPKAAQTKLKQVKIAAVEE
ncbi:Hsp20/alpha crystallin family protein [endosymbiont GvMRE of Glomus versiforme]|uniref:Hsp20/alpha crystallin family protein n=1 Tax=endosymbiont GvMRE of Glomus versiforme TaxID=2039283 RepID=UPI000EC05AE7|nr:Hsp20/alpha crystallin family protein [endosymbiont GvMRE of Glomus versiforme]RHZ37735.1 Heat shock protein Hsp20 [endosymbiont GvMRE of Glomus versiforme]